MLRLLRLFRRSQRNATISGIFVIAVSALLIASYQIPTDFGSKFHSSGSLNQATTSPDIANSAEGQEETTGSQNGTITREYGGLDTKGILQTVRDELESVGWNFSSDRIELQIKRMKLPKLPNKKGGKEQKEDEPTDVLADAVRWKVVLVGCFYESAATKPLITTGESKAVKTTLDCVLNCVRMKCRYFSISNGTSCRCGKRMSVTALNTQFDSRKCDLRCERDNLHACGGEHYASVYHVAVHKYERLTARAILHTSLGCFINSEPLPNHFEPRRLKAKPNSAQCLLACERGDFQIAVWQNAGECRCGKFTLQYSLSKLGQKVNDSFCEKKSGKYVRYMRTYSVDERCESKAFLPVSLGRLVALASFPGSGNTWTRHMIEFATGIYTGSVYGDMRLYEDGFLGEKLEWNSRRTSVIKTHRYSEEEVQSYEGAILIIRDPYDAILAEFNRIRKGHTGSAEPESFNTMEWIYFVAAGAVRWYETIDNLTSMKKEILIIYFEDMIENPILEIGKMVHFLRYPNPNLKERILCLETNLKGDFKREKVHLPFDPFLQRSKDIINLCIQSARKLLETRHFPPMALYER